jgi:hypothetical protein
MEKYKSTYKKKAAAAVLPTRRMPTTGSLLLLIVLAMTSMIGIQLYSLSHDHTLTTPHVAASMLHDAFPDFASRPRQRQRDDIVVVPYYVNATTADRRGDKRRNHHGESNNTKSDNNDDKNDDDNYSETNNQAPPPPVKVSCNTLFSDEHFRLVQNGTCLQHDLLPYTRACQLGSISIDTTKIKGSRGGEDIWDVLQRDETLETLSYDEGALIFHNKKYYYYQTTTTTNTTSTTTTTTTTTTNTTSTTTTTSNATTTTNNNNDDHLLDVNGFPLPTDTVYWIKSFGYGLIDLLKSGLVLQDTTAVAVRKPPPLKNNDNTNNSKNKRGTNATRLEQSNATALLIKRGAYANSCMSLLDMFNVYMVLQKFQLITNDAVDKTFIWLDGHARGHLDIVWETLFNAKPVHIKQLPERIQFQNAIAINTRSVVGDEGLMKYTWRHRTSNTSDCNMDPQNNTLVQFRNFVLQQFGIERSSHPEGRRRRLTFLVRRDYVAHPRSNGRADRTLANLTSDVEYLRSIHPEYDMTVVSFENMTFREQLSQISQTDLFIAVHGAGNIHTLFLPDHATFIEYFPKGYQNRNRFRFLSECLNRTYIAKQAWAIRRVEDKTKVILGLKPRD